MFTKLINKVWGKTRFIYQKNKGTAAGEKYVKTAGLTAPKRKGPSQAELDEARQKVFDGQPVDIRMKRYLAREDRKIARENKALASKEATNKKAEKIEEANTPLASSGEKTLRENVKSERARLEEDRDSKAKSVDDEADAKVSKVSEKTKGEIKAVTAGLDFEGLLEEFKTKNPLETKEGELTAKDVIDEILGPEEKKEEEIASKKKGKGPGIAL